MTSVLKLPLTTFPLYYKLIFERYSQFERFLPKSNPDFFLSFEDIRPIDCTVTHANDLISVQDFFVDQTHLHPTTGCGSYGPPPCRYHEPEVHGRHGYDDRSIKMKHREKL